MEPSPNTIKQHTPAVSVIVPVYNSGPWLKKCLDSIAAQTFSDFEVLMVDDSSTDISPDIMLAFSKQDSRFHCLCNRGKKGVSDARNTGLDAAAGTYITFADSDDWLMPQALETMVDRLEKSRADLLISPGLFITPHLRYPSRRYRRNFLARRERPLSWAAMLQIFPDTVWGKLIPLKLIRDNAIRFEPDMRYGEDSLFCFQCIAHCSSVRCLNRPVYCYNRLRQDSAIHKFYPEYAQWRQRCVEEFNVLCSTCGTARARRAARSYARLMARSVQTHNALYSSEQ